MPNAQRAHFALLDNVVSTAFHALMLVAVLAFSFSLFKPETNRDMLFAAAWMCMLASAGCVVWRLAIHSVQSRNELLRNDAM